MFLKSKTDVKLYRYGDGNVNLKDTVIQQKSAVLALN